MSDQQSFEKDIDRIETLRRTGKICDPKAVIIKTNLEDNYGLENPNVIREPDRQFPYDYRDTILFTRQRNIPEPSFVGRNFSTYDATDDSAIVDFANDSLGGGYFGQGWAQEEILMSETNIPSYLLGSSEIAGIFRSPVLITGLCTHEFTSTGRKIYGNSILGSGGPNTIDRSGITPQNISQYYNRLSNPFPVNIIALSAVDFRKLGRKIYEPADLSRMFTSAYNAFKLCRSQGINTIHTGAWGAGVFGNSENVTAVLQILAAEATGIELIYHSKDRSAFESAMRFVSSSKHRDYGTLTYEQTFERILRRQNPNMHKQHSAYWRPR